MTMTWFAAETMTRGGKRSKRDAHETWVEPVIGPDGQWTGDFQVRYHSTPVVTIHRDGTYTLRSGGHQTRTTKERIGWYSPCNVFQRKHVWYVAEGVEFADGMRVDVKGTVLASRSDCDRAGLAHDTPLGVVQDWYAEHGLEMKGVA